MSTAYRTWVVCSPGLEGVLKKELKSLLGLNRKRFLSPILTGKHAKVSTKGGVECWLPPADLHLVNTHSSVAENVRVRVGKPFRAKYWNELIKGLEMIPANAFIAPGTDVKVRVVSNKSRLVHSKAVEERVHKFLDSKFQAERSESEGNDAPVVDNMDGPDTDTLQPEEQQPQSGVEDESVPTRHRRRRRKARIAESTPVSATMHVQLLKDYCQVSMDASGTGPHRLHNRGFRVNIGRAPIRETLATGCWKAARQDLHNLVPAESPVHVWDPFCGSGTMLLEAFLHEHNSSSSTTLPAGMSRIIEAAASNEHGGNIVYPVQLWPGFPDVSTFPTPRAVDEVNFGGESQAKSMFTGSDISKVELKAARANTANLKHLMRRYLELGDTKGPIPFGDVESLVQNYIREKFNFFVGDASDGAFDKLSASEATNEAAHPLVVFTNLPYGQRAGVSRPKLKTFLEDLVRFGEANSRAVAMYAITPLSSEQLSASSPSAMRWKNVLRFKNGGLSVNLVGGHI